MLSNNPLAIRYLAIVLVAVGTAATCSWAYASALFESVELNTIDARFAFRGVTTVPRDVAMVEIDDVTFSDLGVQWPFRRSLHGDVIRRIAEDGPAAIAYDVQFTEESEVAEDTALIDAVRHSGGVVLATSEVDDRGRTRVFGGDSVLRKVGGRVGHSGIPPDSDGVLRRVPYAVEGVAAFAVVAAEVAQGRRIPQEPGDDAEWIDFHGPPGTIPAVSFADVLHGRLPAGTFRGKVVVVGASAPILQDVHPTTLSGSELMAGPEVQANAISTLLRGAPVSDAPAPVNLALILLLTIVPLFGLRLRFGLAAALGGTAAVVYVLVVYVAFHVSGILVALTYPLLALAMSSAGTVGVRYMAAAVDALEARRALSGGRMIGESVGGYRIERFVGRGAVGSVYLATDVKLCRKVALKILKSELLEDSALREAFLRESRLAAALDHPNVVPIYETGEERTCLYIAMRYVRSSLAVLLERDGTLQAPRTLAILDQVADALDAAHARSLIHRDVSPSNVLLDPATRLGTAEHAFLADFGLTRHGAISDKLDRVGKPDYMAPEQLKGEADGRSDLYSLACMMFECLTGAPPFQSSSEVAVIGGHLTQPPPAVSERRPGLNSAIDAVLARAMSKAAADRFGTCAEFIAAARLALESPARLEEAGTEAHP